MRHRPARAGRVHEIAVAINRATPRETPVLHHLKPLTGAAFWAHRPLATLARCRADTVVGDARAARGRQSRRQRAHGLRLDERRGGAAVLQDFRGRHRHQGELRARVRHRLFSRIAIEFRARQRTWDLVVTTPVNRLPDDVLLQFEPPEAKDLIPQARGPNRRWYGVYAQLQFARLQHQFRQEGGPAEDLRGIPRPQGMGRQDRDRHRRFRMADGIFAHYGEQRGTKLAQDIVARSSRWSPTATSGSRARSAPANTGWRSTTTPR